ncbi:cell surface protein [Fructobacillus fructosus]|uniref:cell surface protein n=1 Tax=Fructobacillus fructosus TaxID=1631 RepID=UPI00021940D7|nr:cell surface protein [Fructobacillus fructosus]
MIYNKRQLTKENNKKVMKKVKKQWVVVSIAAFALLGAGYSGIADNTAHASDASQTNTGSEANSSQTSSKSESSSSASSESKDNLTSEGTNGVTKSSDSTSEGTSGVTKSSDSTSEGTSSVTKSSSTANNTVALRSGDSTQQLEALKSNIYMTNVPATLEEDNWVRVGLQGSFTVENSKLVSGNTIKLADVSVTNPTSLSDAMSNIIKQGSDIEVVDAAQNVHGIIKYVDNGQGTGGTLTYTVTKSNNLTDGGVTDFTMSSNWFYTLNLGLGRTNYSKAPFNADFTVKGFGGSSNTSPIQITPSQIKTVDAQIIEPDKVGAAPTVGAQDSGATIREYLDHTVIPNDTEFMNLQNSNGTSGTVDLTNPVISYEKITSSQKFDVTSGSVGVVTFFVNPDTKKVQALDKNHNVYAHYGDDYAKEINLSITNAGENLSLDDLKKAVKGTGLYYSIQSDGSAYVIKCVAKSDLVLTADQIKAGIDLDQFNLTDPSSNAIESKNATIDFYAHQLQMNGGAGQVQTGTNITVFDKMIAATVKVQQLDANGNVISTATTQTQPNSSHLAGQSAVKVHYIDQDGRDLSYIDTTWGYPTSSSQKQATIKPASIPGFSVDTSTATIPSNANAPEGSKIITSATEVDFPTADTTVNYYVIYKGDTQKAKVTFIDDTAKKVLAEENLEGPSKTLSNYRPQSQINSYENSGYELVSNDYPTNGVQFDTDDSHDQTFEIHLKHKTTESTESKTVKETIHYEYADGTEAASTYTKDVTFTRTAYKDAVTDDVTYGPWSADQSFAAVTSPSLKGYTADQGEIAAQTVSGNSSDLNFTVKYTKNAPAESTDTTIKNNPSLVSIPSHQVSQPMHSTKENTLPETGETDKSGSVRVSLISGLFLSLIGFVTFGKFKKNKSE